MSFSRRSVRPRAQKLFFAMVALGMAWSSPVLSAKNCFDDMVIEPAFIAFTAKAGSNLGTWYQDVFGLDIAKTFGSEDGAIKGVLMRREEFVVELFFRKDAIHPLEEMPLTHPAQWQGIKKFGIYTDANLTELKTCLLQNDIDAGRIFNDEILGIDLLLVTDPENNSIEIIRRH